MKTKLIATLMLAGSSLFAGPRFSFGIGIGVPVAPAPVVVAPAPVVAYAPPCPGPGYTWIGGGYYFTGGHRVWRPGYWRAPVFHGRFR